MFVHTDIAMLGLYPNKNGFFYHKSCALRGETYVEISRINGGGGGPSNGLGVYENVRSARYCVFVRVKLNGVWTEDSVVVDDFQARVSASLYGIETFSENDAMISVNGIQILEPKVTANVLTLNNIRIN